MISTTPSHDRSQTITVESLPYKTFQQEQQDQPLRSQIVKGAKGISDFSKDWDDLFTRAVGAPPYLSRPWVNVFINEGQVSGIPLFVLAWSGDKLVGLMPLALCKFMTVKVARPISTGKASYLGLLLDADYPSVVECIADLITSQKLFDIYCSQDLSSEDVVTNDLLNKLSQRGYSRRKVPRVLCPYVQLGCSFEDYLKNNKSRESRQKLLRKERKLYKERDVKMECYSDSEITPEIIRRAALIQRESWLKRRGAAVLSEPFYEKLSLKMAEAGFGRIWLLTINGEDAAFTYALSAHKRQYYQWTAFKLKYATSLSVGVVLMMATIRKICEEGALSCCFGHGNSEWKRRWANKCYEVDRIVVGSGFGGRLLAVCYFIIWRWSKVKWLHSLYRRMKNISSRSN